MFADPGQVEHEGLLEFEPDLLGEFAQQRIAVAVFGGATEVVVPVRRPFDLRILAGDQRFRPGHRGVPLGGGGGEVLVVVGPGFVVVLQFGQDGVAEDGEQFPPPSATFEFQIAAAVQFPAAPPFLLVLVGAWITLSGSGFHIVEPDVFDSGAIGPRLFARHRTGMAADTFIEIHHHRHLRHDPHQ